MDGPLPDPETLDGDSNNLPVRPTCFSKIV